MYAMVEAHPPRQVLPGLDRKRGCKELLGIACIDSLRHQPRSTRSGLLNARIWCSQNLVFTMLRLLHGHLLVHLHLLQGFDI